jgi:hypothetical protein
MTTPTGFVTGVGVEAIDLSFDLWAALEPFAVEAQSSESLM